MIHKLADGPITLTVARVETGFESKYNPGTFQVKFVGEDGTEVFMSEVTATKQLERLRLDFTSAVGETLYMEQVKKNGTTFHNIARGTGGSAPAPAAGAPAPRAAAAPASAAPKVSLAELAAVYGECVSYAMGTLGMKCEEAGIPIDAQAIQSAAATLFIRAMR